MLKKDYKEIDLRSCYMKLQDKANSSKIKAEMEQIIRDTTEHGKALILNFDDNSIHYDKTHDPDIREFYGKRLLSYTLWTPKLFFQNKCYYHHMGEESRKLNAKFRFVAYSKFTIDGKLVDNEIVNLLEKRFEYALPLHNINFIILG